MYFINRSKLEEPCPFIVACYNLGDRKDHDLELAMHTASKQAQCAQAAHSLLDMDPCYAAAATAVTARGLTCLRTQSIFFLRWRSLPIRRRSFLLYMLCACTQFFFTVHHDNIIYTHLALSM